jgi:hypothetical protein
MFLDGLYKFYLRSFACMSGSELIDNRHLVCKEI